MPKILRKLTLLALVVIPLPNAWRPAHMDRWPLAPKFPDKIAPAAEKESPALAEISNQMRAQRSLMRSA